MSIAGPPKESDARGDLALLLSAIAARLRHVVTDPPVSPPALRNTLLDCVRALEHLAGPRAWTATAAHVFASEQTDAAAAANVQPAGAASVHCGGQEQQRPPSDGP